MMCDKVVWDKVVCERWCVTKLCVKGVVSQSGVWKMVCHKVVCERWCVTKLCVYERWWVKDCMSLHTLHSTLHTSYSILHTPHSTLSTPHSTLYTLHLTLQTLHFTLCTLHSTLCTLHSTLHTLHSTLHTLHFTLRTPPTTVYTLHCPPPAVMILSPLVNRLLEAQTICSTFGRLLLALQPFAPLPQYHFSSPCKLSCSEPQRTLLSFGVPPFSSVFPLLWTIFLHFPSFFSYLFFPHSSIFPLFSTIFLHFPWLFPPFFLPESTDLGGIEAYRHLFA